MTCNKDRSTWIKEETWKGHKSIRFSAGGYEALMIPEVGANVVELKEITTKGGKKSGEKLISFNKRTKKAQREIVKILF